MIKLNSNQRIKLNIGGELFEILFKNIQREQTGRLWKICNTIDESLSANLFEFCDDYNLKELEFFFDRDPTLFSHILNYYRLGKLHISENLCPVSLNNELIYWGIDHPLMEVCCEEKLYNKEKEVDKNLIAYSKIINEVKMEKLQEAKERSNRFKILKTRIWNIVENSFGINSPLIAKLFGTISIIFIIISTISLILGSIPVVKIQETDQLSNLTDIEYETSTNSSSIISYLKLIENCCVLWFTFEYLIRFLSTPNLIKFMVDFLNFIDILCLLPFYFGIFLNEYSFFLRIRHLMQMLRVLRLLKLGRYSEGIKSFSYALKASSTTLYYLLVLLAFNVLVFSSILYFAENEDPNTKFTSILASCWWNIITTTTVGYGDMIPETSFGKLIASFSAVFGIMTIAFPIEIISKNFNAYEKYSNRRQKALKLLENSNFQFEESKRKN